jgi:hypothetical protein
MTNLLDSAGRVASVLLVALSTIGTIASFNQFYGLGSIETALQSKRTLSDALSARIESAYARSQGAATPSNSLKSAHEEIGSVDQSVTKAVREWRSIQQLDMALWGLMFVTSCVSLIAYRAKRHD